MMEIFNLSYAEQKQQDIADQVRSLRVHQERSRRTRSGFWGGFLRIVGRVLTGKKVKESRENPPWIRDMDHRVRHAGGTREY